MVTFSDKELMLIAIALEEEHENECKRKWVHEAWKNRDNEGEFATLFKELMDDGTKFFQYFRMSESTFNLLLSKVAVHLKKKNTHLRKAISPKERLAISSDRGFIPNNFIQVSHGTQHCTQHCNGNLQSNL